MNKIESETQASYSSSSIPDEEYIRVALAILKKRMKRPDTYVSRPEDAINYLKLKIGECEREIFSVMFFDNQNGIITYEELFSGTIDGAAVYPREIIKRALEVNAKSILLSHNHPSGNVMSSSTDVRITIRIKQACELVDIKVLDHVIVSPVDSYSMEEHGEM